MQRKQYSVRATAAGEGQCPGLSCGTTSTHSRKCRWSWCVRGRLLHARSGSCQAPPSAVRSTPCFSSRWLGWHLDSCLQPNTTLFPITQSFRYSHRQLHVRRNNRVMILADVACLPVHKIHATFTGISVKCTKNSPVTMKETVSVQFILRISKVTVLLFEDTLQLGP